MRSTEVHREIVIYEEKSHKKGDTETKSDSDRQIYNRVIHRDIKRHEWTKTDDRESDIKEKTARISDNMYTVRGRETEGLTLCWPNVLGEWGRVA